MKFRRAVIVALLSLLATIGTIEGGLRLFDPWGIARYEADIYILAAASQPDPVRNVVYSPGVVTFSNFSMTVLPDHSRAVPDTSAAGCTIAFLGDSVTLGWGVNDEATWVNLVARELPGVHVVNTGVSGYSIYDIEATMKTVKADGYFYLLIVNDNRRMRHAKTTAKPDYRSAIDRNLAWFMLGRDLDPPFDDAFYAVLEKMISKGVAVAAFDEPPGRGAAARYPVKLIPMYTSWLSFIDRHADAEGNRQIAASVLPIVTELAATRCRIM
jgi:hypothetical protein